MLTSWVRMYYLYYRQSRETKGTPVQLCNFNDGDEEWVTGNE